jgi:hypothetical protein
MAHVYTHVRPRTILPATADSRMHADFKQVVGDFRNELLAYGERLAGGQGRSAVGGDSLRPRLPSGAWCMW